MKAFLGILIIVRQIYLVCFSQKAYLPTVSLLTPRLRQNVKYPTIFNVSPKYLSNADGLELKLIFNRIIYFTITQKIDLLRV